MSRVGLTEQTSCRQDVLALDARGLSFTYPHRDTPVFSQLDLSIEAGEILGVLGNNGAGKSTVLDILVGIVKPASGTVQVGGVDLSNLKRRETAQRIAYVTQRQSIPRLRVYDEVLLGRKPYITWSITDYDRDVVARAIARLNLEEFSNRYCDELSGGERQKVFIARALAQEPRILVLDEPTSALDPKNQVEVMQAVRDATKRDKLATIVVMHDLNLALRFCNRFVLMRDGVVIAEGDEAVITEENLFATYGAHFTLVDAHGIKMAAPLVQD